MICKICKDTGRLGYDLCPDCDFGGRPTTPAQVTERLDAIRGVGDPEWTHLAADKVLLAFLEDLGYHTVVEAYNRIDPKWYS